MYSEDILEAYSGFLTPIFALVLKLVKYHWTDFYYRDTTFWRNLFLVQDLGSSFPSLSLSAVTLVFSIDFKYLSGLLFCTDFTIVGFPLLSCVINAHPPFFIIWTFCLNSREASGIAHKFLARLIHINMNTYNREQRDCFGMKIKEGKILKHMLNIKCD